MTKDQKKQFLRDVDLEKTNFEIKITDFGFSKKLKNKNQINLTTCGTPLYMAPQVVDKKSYGYKSDIWSIGVILFELLNGLTPFHSKNRAEFEGKVEQSDYSFKDSVVQNLTLEAISFLSSCLQHVEADRKCITELITHPYITTKFYDQHKLDQKNMQFCLLKPKAFKNDLVDNSAKGKEKRKRAESVAPSKLPSLAGFNAKNRTQAKNIEKAVLEVKRDEQTTA